MLLSITASTGGKAKTIEMKKKNTSPPFSSPPYGG
jgi:hypothetical protein